VVAVAAAGAKLLHAARSKALAAKAAVAIRRNGCEAAV
jgi:hypothetical protein